MTAENIRYHKEEAKARTYLFYSKIFKKANMARTE